MRRFAPFARQFTTGFTGVNLLIIIFDALTGSPYLVQRSRVDSDLHYTLWQAVFTISHSFLTRAHMLYFCFSVMAGYLLGS